MDEMTNTSPYMTTKELAELLRTTPGAIRQMRHRGDGPQGTRIGRGVLYSRTDVEAWLTAKTRADKLTQRAAA